VTFATSALILVAAAVICFGLLRALMPLLERYALAKPNARSSHKVPTPQGGGIAVLTATIVVIAATTVFFGPQLDDSLNLMIVILAAAGLAAVGAMDDLRPMEAAPRLLLQTAASIAVVATLPPEMSVVPVVPWWLDRIVMVVGGVWLVNVVNFMDGIDWMTVAEIVPVTAALAVFGLIGALPLSATIMAVALCGAVVGFAPLNRPIARLFLGDVGSLPIGLVLAWMLILLAGRGHLAAAILLPLYYLADTTATLLQRLAKGEQITQAHRSHFYQRALDGGFSVYQIVSRVFLLNVVLAGLAFLSVAERSLKTEMTSLVAGFVLVGLLLWHFKRGHRHAV
jgi:UDP-N-acetylmuramyl pentapeptide phosphotransferase/UDP-N-acetylglucosamine-1-phosphate transferase